jgi:hypothetical protein
MSTSTRSPAGLTMPGEKTVPGTHLGHGIVELHPPPPVRVAELEHLEVGHAAGPGQKVGARLEPLNLLPERQGHHLIPYAARARAERG